MEQCEYCEKEFDSENALYGHLSVCPERQGNESGSDEDIEAEPDDGKDEASESDSSDSSPTVSIDDMDDKFFEGASQVKVPDYGYGGDRIDYEAVWWEIKISVSYYQFRQLTLAEQAAIVESETPISVNYEKLLGIIWFSPGDKLTIMYSEDAGGVDLSSTDDYDVESLNHNQLRALASRNDINGNQSKQQLRSALAAKNVIIGYDEVVS